MVLVYPGSDFDSFRPWRDRHRVELAGRSGFIALALRERVPIIPVVSAGTHEQWIVLTRGDRLARVLHTGALFRTKVLPLALALPFGLTFGLFPYLPIPAQTSIAFGQPISWPELGAEALQDGTILARCHDQVRHAMQAMLDGLAAGRIPFIGQPATRRREVDELLARPISPQSGA
jgi:1-acyl-sn-glycerol-3-phosphate acyltransferase